MILNKSRFSHICSCIAALGIGVLSGRLGLKFAEPLSGEGYGFIHAFLRESAVSVIPLVILLICSVTVYSRPAVIASLIFEGALDGRLIFSCIPFITDSADTLPCIFFITVRTCFAYIYLLLAVRTLEFRDYSSRQPGSALTLFSKKSLFFFRDFTAVAGVLCIFAFFAHSVFTYL